MKKRIVSVILTLCMVLSFVPTTVFAAEGITPTTPQKDTGGVYQIGTAEELYGFAQLVNSKAEPSANAVLTADIVVNTGVLNSDGTLNTGTFTDWTPIGKNSNPYSGTFDGQGHTISGLYFNNPSTDYVGLFGYLSLGEIKNVGVIDSYFRGNRSVGGVCGENRGTITGCYNTGKVSSYIHKGGVCGFNDEAGTITGCYTNNGDVCGANDGTITGCYTNNGDVCGNNRLEPDDALGTVTDCGVKSDAEFANGTVCGLLNTALKNANSDVRFYQSANYPKLIINVPKLVDGVYQIGTAEELYGFAQFVNSGNTDQNTKAVLTADITVNNNLLSSLVFDDNENVTNGDSFESWTPIGNNSNKYTGTFDGQGHTISGLYYNISRDDVGLFGFLGTDGEIKNVGVIDSYLYGNNAVGGVCGRNDNGTINGCYNTGEVSGTGNDVGGVCGNNIENGTITGCYNTGTVSGKELVGGVCGHNFDSTITGCYNTGTVSGKELVGGVCGYNANRGTITGCYNTGTVSGTGNYVGGVCGDNDDFSTITGCYNTGTVSGSDKVGGVCGYNAEFSKITACYNTGTVSGGDGSSNIGGVCGFIRDAIITGCYTNNGGVYGAGDATVTDCAEHKDADFADGTVCGLLNTALKNYGSDVRFYQGVKSPEFIHAPQLVDDVYQIGTAAELYGFAELVNGGNTSASAVLTADIVVNTGVLKDDGNLADDTSGFTSWTPIGNLDNRYTGKFDGQGHTISGLYFNDSSTSYVGLFGCLGSNGEIKNVGVIGSYLRGDVSVGGVCGFNEGGTITGSYNAGTVSGKTYVGGVCAVNKGGKIIGCYNIGTVIGVDIVGGVSGWNDSGTITGCYNTGRVSGREIVGGVCGQNYGTITGCYTNNKHICGLTNGTVTDCDVKTDAEFANGTVCKLLNTALKNANSKVLFCQTIGTDASPLLDYQIEEHTPIYTVENNTFKFFCLCGKKSKTMELTLKTDKTVVVNGGENTLTAELSNLENEVVTYKWYQNDALIENATSNTYKMTTNLSLGTYTYKVDVSMENVGTITQSVSVFVDNDPPTGEISVGTKSWTESPDNITFDSFFKDTQTVTITANDNSGKPVTIEYLVSHKELTADELANATFTAYSDTFNINSDNEYVIYAKLTDESGNVAYINSNGIVLDSVAPVISGIENGKTYCEAQTFTVTEKYLKSVTVNGTEVSLDENNQFTLNPAEGTQEIVVTDKAGNVSDEMIVTVNNGHTDENPKDHNCDICGENVGVHKDINKDHKCDYGCDEAIGEHKDENSDHKCDYGCDEAIGEHKDENNDHKCDYGCNEPIGEHKVADGKHTCDYCGKEMTTCKDENPIDHKCDICGATLSQHSGGTATCTNKATCDICDEPYGELDSTNHNLENIPAKKATVTQEGNIEYWHCVDCGKYFSDKDGKNSIELKDTVIAKLPAEDEQSCFAPLMLKAENTKNKTVKLTWTKLKDAKGYIVYGVKCGNDLKKIKTVKGNSYTIKNLKKGIYYKYMVVAYKTVDGKQVTISNSKIAHVAVKGGKYGNATKITVNKIKPIKQGEKLTLKVMVKTDKKVKNHVPIRYESSNTKIAKVNSKGVITAKSKGECNIYVYAQNGVYKKVKVTVK